MRSFSGTTGATRRSAALTPDALLVARAEGDGGSGNSVTQPANRRNALALTQKMIFGTAIYLEGRSIGAEAVECTIRFILKIGWPQRRAKGAKNSPESWPEEFRPKFIFCASCLRHF